MKENLKSVKYLLKNKDEKREFIQIIIDYIKNEYNQKCGKFIYLDNPKELGQGEIYQHDVIQEESKILLELSKVIKDMNNEEPLNINLSFWVVRMLPDIKEDFQRRLENFGIASFMNE